MPSSQTNYQKSSIEQHRENNKKNPLPQRPQNQQLSHNKHNQFDTKKYPLPQRAPNQFNLDYSNNKQLFDKYEINHHRTLPQQEHRPLNMQNNPNQPNERFSKNNLNF